MENPFPPRSASLGSTFPPSIKFGMPSSISTQELENPFRKTTLGSNSHDEEEVYQDEDPIGDNNIPSDVKTFLVDPYNIEMMEKSIRENKTEIFLNLVKYGINVPTSFDESTLFRKITKKWCSRITNFKHSPNIWQRKGTHGEN